MPTIFPAKLKEFQQRIFFFFFCGRVMRMDWGNYVKGGGWQACNNWGSIWGLACCISYILKTLRKVTSPPPPPRNCVEATWDFSLHLGFLCFPFISSTFSSPFSSSCQQPMLLFIYLKSRCKDITRIFSYALDGSQPSAVLVFQSLEGRLLLSV
jgi:hypothetical protein